MSNEAIAEVSLPARVLGTIETIKVVRAALMAAGVPAPGLDLRRVRDAVAVLKDNGYLVVEVNR